MLKIFARSGLTNGKIHAINVEKVLEKVFEESFIFPLNNPNQVMHFFLIIRLASLVCQYLGFQT